MGLGVYDEHFDMKSMRRKTWIFSFRLEVRE